MPKDIYLIRHGQSTFNAHCESCGGDPMLFDARLSDLGVAQVADARQAAAGIGADLIVVSPLTRALQTASGIFGDRRIPTIVSSLHRERLESSCDVGRAPALLAPEFPMFDFDHLADIWWHDGEKDDRGIAVEPDHSFSRRVGEFSRWIAARPEATLAVVGHGTFFHSLAGRYLQNCEIMKYPA